MKTIMVKKIFFHAGFFLNLLFSWGQQGEIINHIYEGNNEANKEKYTQAEIKYRKALSLAPEESKALYNLGNAHYKEKNFDEASQRFFQTQKFSQNKNVKHRAFHNMGNVFMKKKDYAKAVESYKNALRNNPKDNETRYNYALAKELLEKEKQKNDNKDKEKENKEKENKSEKKESNNDKKENDDKNKDEKSNKKNEDQNNESKKDNNDKGNQKKEQNRKRKSGQLSLEQVKSLLEAMNNQEKNVQNKIKAKKVKGSPIKNVKDW